MNIVFKMIELTLKDDTKYGGQFGSEEVKIIIPSRGNIKPIKLPIKGGYDVKVCSPSELQGLPEIVVDKEGDNFEEGHFYIHCVYAEERKEWVGIVRKEGYFDSVTHRDSEWDPNSPYTLDEEYAAKILEAYKIPQGRISMDKVLSTSPSELEKLALEKIF